LLHALTKGANLIIGAIFQPEKRKQLVDAGAAFLAGHQAQGGKEFQVLASSQSFIECWRLGQHTGLLAHLFPLARGIQPQHPHLAC
jgi:hypothetical protein